MKIDENTYVGDVLDYNSKSEEVFLEFDMPCTDCPSARGETLQEACGIHNVDISQLISRLKESLKI